MEGRWNNETRSVSEEDAYRPIYELLVSPCVTPETGVIKTLLDRCNNIVSEPEDREKEVEHITKALERCGYPSCTITKVTQQQFQKEKKKKEKNTEQSKGMVIFPYVKGVIEPIHLVLKHYEIATSVRPHQNTRKMLVHPKDKVKYSKTTYCIYQIHRKSCNHTAKEKEQLEQDSKNTTRRLKTLQPDDLSRNRSECQRR